MGNSFYNNNTQYTELAEQATLLAQVQAAAATVAAEQAAIDALQVVAGSGLTGGGTLGSNVTLNVGAGTGIQVNADTIQVKPSALAEIGGVKAINPVSHQFVTSIGTDGTPALAQPAAGDVSGLAASATTDTTNAANITSGTLPAARLPSPAVAALGGVKSNAGATHQWVSAINTDGTVTLTQPAAADVSGLAASATTDTTNAANITSGALPIGRVPAITGGDVTASAGSAVHTIAANAVTNAKSAQMAANTIKGNNTGAPANAADLTATQATAMFNAMVGATGTVAGTKGLVPAPAATDNVKFLRGDGTFAVPAGAGDVLAANNGTEFTPATFASNLKLVRVVKTQVFTASGTYTPSTGMVYCLIEGPGGGGGGGGTANTGAAISAIGGGGGGGEFASLMASAATIGASKAVVIGAAGTAGPAGNNAGGNGGDTTLGATIFVAKGGTGGSGSTGGANAAAGAGGTGGTGDFKVPGQRGQIGIAQGGNITIPGGGGGSAGFGFGSGAPNNIAATTTAGFAGSNYGGAGAGGASFNAGGTAAGGAGAPGFLRITEYCTQ